MSEVLAPLDARGRAAGAALRRATALRTLPEAPAGRRVGWTRPALVLTVVVLVVAGLVAVSRRGTTPADDHDPRRLRFLIGELPPGWELVAVKDAGVQTGEVPTVGRYAVLYATPGDPSARAIQLQWADPATPEGQRYPTMDFSNLLFTENVEEFDAAGRRAACGEGLEVGYLCYVETDQGMVQAVTKALSLQQVRDALSGVRFVDGRPALTSDSLPSGLAPVHSGPEWLFPVVMNPDSPEVASVEYRSSSGAMAFLVVGWADQHDLAESALQLPWSRLQVGNYPGFSADQGPDLSGRSLLWNRDGVTFALSVHGEFGGAMSLANSVRRAADAEWAAAPLRAVGEPTESVATTASVDDATLDTVPPPTLGAGTVVTDQPLDMVVTENTRDDVDFDVRIDGTVIPGVSVTTIGDSYGVRLPAGGGFGGSIGESISLQPIGGSQSGATFLGSGVMAHTGGAAGATLRVTATNGVRYLVDLVQMPNHPALRIAVVMLPTGVYVVSADVVDAAGTVVTGS